MGLVMRMLPDRLLREEWRSGRTFVAHTDTGVAIEIYTSLGEVHIRHPDGDSDVVLCADRPQIEMGLQLTIPSYGDTEVGYGTVTALGLAMPEILLIGNRRELQHGLQTIGVAELHARVYPDSYELRVVFTEPGPIGIYFFSALNDVEELFMRVTGVETHVNRWLDPQPGERQIL